MSVRITYAATFIAALISVSASAQQGPGAPPALAQCSNFNSLADQHADNAQNLQKAIEAQAAAMPPEDGKKFIEDKSKATKSEWELAGLAREAYRKCLKDYLAGGAAPAPQAATPAPQPAPQPVQQAPVQQQVQQPRPVQQPVQQQYVRRQQPQQEEEAQRPSLLPLIGLGIGLGREF